MSERHAFGAVDVARLNSGVFLAVLRRYGVLFVIGAPVYFATVVLVGEHRAPGLGAGRILAAIWPYFLTGFVGHLLVGFLVVAFIVSVGSLFWWRHVLAVGGLSAALAAIASTALRLVTRFARGVNNDAVATLFRRERATLADPVHDLLDELRAALLASPDAPPLRLALLADRSVRSDQSISRRVA